MSTEKRMNEGYEIIESRTIGSAEFVIGHNPAAGNPYVCWHCKNGTDYFWGHYTNELSSAQNKMRERYNNVFQNARDNGQKPPKKHDEHERF